MKKYSIKRIITTGATMAVAASLFPAVGNAQEAPSSGSLRDTSGVVEVADQKPSAFLVDRVLRVTMVRHFQTPGFLMKFFDFLLSCFGLSTHTFSFRSFSSFNL